MSSRSRIYLDHAATSWPKPAGVAEAMVAFLDSAGGNPGRGGHRLTVESSRRIEGARQQIATLLGGDPERTLVGPGCTFWLNTLLRALLRPGDRVVTSALEHNAVMRPLRALAEERQLDVEAITGGGGHGVPTADEVAAAVATAPTSLVILTHASNVTGAVLPVAEIAAAIRPVPVVVDGAQTAGCVPFDFAHSGLAAWTCSGHKGLLGPPGTGLLLVAPSLDLEPLVLGGTGSNSESEEMPAWLPDRLEAGTPNGPGIVGLGAACRWLADRGVQTVADHEHELVEHLVAGLAAVAGVTVVGRDHGGPTTGTVSFSVEGVDIGDAATLLDRDHGVMLRAGLHCAPAAHRRLGTFPEGTLRASVGPLTTAAEIDALITGVCAVFRGASSSAVGPGGNRG